MGYSERCWIVQKLLVPAACLFVVVGLAHARVCSSELLEERVVQTVRLPINVVNFDNAQLLSRRQKQEVIKVLREKRVASGSPKEDLSYLTDEAAEMVRTYYQDQGYFKVQVEAKATGVAGRPTRRYDVLIQVREAGRQYRLGDLRIRHGTVFTEQRLRDLFPIEQGQIFSREKIAKGLENVRRLFGSYGYIDFTAVPETTFDEQQAVASLQIDLDEGPMFHWGDLNVEGMRDQDRQTLLQAWDELRGETYVAGKDQLEVFFGKFFLPLRKGASLADCAQIKFNESTGTVDVYVGLVLNPDVLKLAETRATGH